MKRSVALLQLVGYVFTVVAGSLLHFLYGWTGGSRIAALVGSVNEATFEHMKLFFFPAFLYALFERRYFREDGAYWCVKLRGIILGTVLIPVLFYTANGCFGHTPDYVNIAIFFVAAAGAFLLETRLFRRGGARCQSDGGAFLVLCSFAVLFWVFTFCPPRIPLFRDPVTGGLRRRINKKRGGRAPSFFALYFSESRFSISEISSFDVCSAAARSFADTDR